MDAYDDDADYFIDENGCLGEVRDLGGTQLVIHYDDIPDSDKTIVDGLPVTTPLRTAIDLAIQVGEDDLERLVRECLERRLFTRAEAWERISQPDIRDRVGTWRFARVLERCRHV